MQIANTHFNMIDTLVCLIGINKWQKIVAAFFKNITPDGSGVSFVNVSNWIAEHRRIPISANMEGHVHYSREFCNNYVDWDSLELELGTPLDNASRYTLSELFVWAMTEANVSETEGYGFRKK